MVKNRLASMPDIDAMVRKTRADSEPEAETGAVAELSELFGLSGENGGETTLRQVFEGLASHRSESGISTITPIGFETSTPRIPCGSIPCFSLDISTLTRRCASTET